MAAGAGGDSALISGDILDTVGGASLTKTGLGTLILSGSDTYMGGTIVEAGTLELASPTALAEGSGLDVGQNAAAVFGLSLPTASFAPATAGVAVVPEPGTLILLLAAVSGAAVYRRRSWVHGARRRSRTAVSEGV